MNDPIIKAYLKAQEPIKTPQQATEKLPIIYDGKNDPLIVPIASEEPKEQPIQEAMVHHQPDDFDFAEFQSKQDTPWAKHPNPEVQAYDDSIHELYKKGPVTKEKIDMVNSVLRHAAEKFDPFTPEMHHLSSKWSRVPNQLLNKDIKDYNGTDTLMSKSELETHLHDHPNLKAIEGRTAVLNPDDTKGEFVYPYLKLHPNGTSEFSQGSLHSFDDTPPTIKSHEKRNEEHENLMNHHDEHIQNHKPFHSPTVSLKQNVHDYTSDFSRPMNGHLVAKYHFGEGLPDEMIRQSTNYKLDNEESLEQRIDGLSEGIKEAPKLPDEHVVFTGMGEKAKINEHMHKHLSEGNSGPMKFHSPAFLSTSLDLGTAAGFVKLKSLSDEPNREIPYKYAMSDILKIHLPKDYKRGLYVDGHSANRGEKEYVLDKDQKIAIQPHPQYFMHDSILHRLWEAHPIKDEE